MRLRPRPNFGRSACSWPVLGRCGGGRGGSSGAMAARRLLRAGRRARRRRHLRHGGWRSSARHRTHCGRAHAVRGPRRRGADAAEHRERAAGPGKAARRSRRGQCTTARRGGFRRSARRRGGRIGDAGCHACALPRHGGDARSGAQAPGLCAPGSRRARPHACHRGRRVGGGGWRGEHPRAAKLRSARSLPAAARTAVLPRLRHVRLRRGRGRGLPRRGRRRPARGGRLRLPEHPAGAHGGAGHDAWRARRAEARGRGAVVARAKGARVLL
mmetsp:Transcript_41072/g.128738  ORF Transcript_41072/g.128738 Transcript_41072/m.128738 type:complete len:271 (-) Transcript_41072:519-1331(-)